MLPFGRKMRNTEETSSYEKNTSFSKCAKFSTLFFFSDAELNYLSNGDIFVGGGHRAKNRVFTQNEGEGVPVVTRYPTYHHHPPSPLFWVKNLFFARWPRLKIPPFDREFNSASIPTTFRVISQVAERISTRNTRICC